MHDAVVAHEAWLILIPLADDHVLERLLVAGTAARVRHRRQRHGPRCELVESTREAAAAERTRPPRAPPKARGSVGTPHPHEREACVCARKAPRSWQEAHGFGPITPKTRRPSTHTSSQPDGRPHEPPAVTRGAVPAARRYRLRSGSWDSMESVPTMSPSLPPADTVRVKRPRTFRSRDSGKVGAGSRAGAGSLLTRSR